MNLFFLCIYLTNAKNVQIWVIYVYKQTIATGSKRGCVLEGTAYLSSSIMYICTCQVSFALDKTVNSCLFLVLDDKSSSKGIIDVSYVMIYLIFKGAKNQTLTKKSFSSWYVSLQNNHIRVLLSKISYFLHSWIIIL